MEDWEIRQEIKSNVDMLAIPVAVVIGFLALGFFVLAYNVSYRLEKLEKQNISETRKE